MYKGIQLKNLAILCLDSPYWTGDTISVYDIYIFSKLPVAHRLCRFVLRIGWKTWSFARSSLAQFRTGVLLSLAYKTPGTRKLRSMEGKFSHSLTEGAGYLGLGREAEVTYSIAWRRTTFGLRQVSARNVLHTQHRYLRQWHQVISKFNAKFVTKICNHAVSAWFLKQGKFHFLSYFNFLLAFHISVLPCLKMKSYNTKKKRRHVCILRSLNPWWISHSCSAHISNWNSVINIRNVYVIYNP